MSGERRPGALLDVRQAYHLWAGPEFASLGNLEQGRFIARQEIPERFSDPDSRRVYTSEWGMSNTLALHTDYHLKIPGFENGYRQELIGLITETRKAWGDKDKEQMSRHVWKLHIGGKQGTHIATVDEGTGDIMVPYGRDADETIFWTDTVFNALNQSSSESRDS